jgi:hypothetical protein
VAAINATLDQMILVLPANPAAESVVSQVTVEYREEERV